MKWFRSIFSLGVGVSLALSGGLAGTAIARFFAGFGS